MLGSMLTSRRLDYKKSGSLLCAKRDICEHVGCQIGDPRFRSTAVKIWKVHIGIEKVSSGHLSICCYIRSID